jgi:hypothetical protein
MALALESTGRLATSTEVGEWVHRMAHAELADRAKIIAEIERASDTGIRLGSSVPPEDVEHAAAELASESSGSKPESIDGALPSGALLDG